MTDGHVSLEVHGLDVHDATTGVLRSSG